MQPVSLMASSGNRLFDSARGYLRWYVAEAVGSAGADGVATGQFFKPGAKVAGGRSST
jgi:hypothetical protein